MKKNLCLAMAISIAMVSGSMAQQVRNCGTMSHLHEMEANDPQLINRMQEIEIRSQNWIKQQEGTANKTSAVITIPVVVHVVYRTAAENISDAQIQSQIAILNQDFRKLNADVALVPSAFAGLASDCEIEFCLAQRDPNGNATNGIVRKQTTATSFSYTSNAIKYSSSGGDNAWNSAQYLNIWVGTLSGGVLGYAQFPGGAAATDGVVILNTAFGNTGTATAPFNKGRTATHEVGHWLNLYHIWGDDGSACTGSDQCADTPNQGAENYGTPPFPRTDACSPASPGVMFMNYMDYVDDAAMFMFTAGQKSRMVAALNTSRTGILTSQGCVPPSTGSCGTPASLNATAITTSGATLGWGTVSGATSYNVQYKATSASTWTSTTSATTSKAITGLSAATSYQFQVQAVCSTSTGAYSTAATFTTSAASCTDSYESNNSRNNAKTIAMNADISAKIASGTDKDWFKFTTVSGATNLKVVLDQLPADYDLKLYGPNGGTLATSQLSGTSAETITRNTSSTNSYFVQVYPYSSSAFNNTVCYRLRVNTSGTAFRQGVSEEFTEGNINPEKMAAIDGITLYPNPSSDQINLSFFMENESRVQLEVIDMLGKSVFNSSFSGVEGFNKTEISTSDLTNGIYFVRIIQNEMSIVQKFMVKH